MISFTVTLLVFFIQINGLGIDTLNHTIQYYEMMLDRMQMQQELNQAKLISRYADIVISVFTGLVAVVFTPIFKTVGEYLANKTKQLLNSKKRNHEK